MRSLLIIIIAVTLVVPAYAQESPLAKSAEEYTKMFHNLKMKMVRSHADFYAEAQKNRTVWKYLRDDKFAAAFLQDLKFCKDGLVTLNLRVRDEAFDAAVGEILGFERSFWKRWKKGFCCEDGSCTPCSVHSRCDTRNCGKALLTGDLYNPQEVLGSGR